MDYIKDLGVFFDSQLTFSKHIHQKINKAYSMLGIIKRNFIHMDPRTFILLYKTLVRPHVEYPNSVYGDLEIWLRGHSRSLKLVPFKSLGAVSYSPSIVTMAVSLAISEIFSVKEWPDLEM